MAGPKLHVKKGDTVIVIAGKDRGRKGKVLEVDTAKRRVVVEGINVGKKHQRPTQKVMQGGIVDKELPIHASNVLVFCPRCGKPSRTKRITLDDGKRVRACVRCDEVLDK